MIKKWSNTSIRLFAFIQVAASVSTVLLTHCSSFQPCTATHTHVHTCTIGHMIAPSLVLPAVLTETELLLHKSLHRLTTLYWDGKPPSKLAWNLKTNWNTRKCFQRRFQLIFWRSKFRLKCFDWFYLLAMNVTFNVWLKWTQFVHISSWRGFWQILNLQLLLCVTPSSDDLCKISLQSVDGCWDGGANCCGDELILDQIKTLMINVVHVELFRFYCFQVWTGAEMNLTWKQLGKPRCNPIIFTEAFGDCLYEAYLRLCGKKNACVTCDIVVLLYKCNYSWIHDLDPTYHIHLTPRPQWYLEWIMGATSSASFHYHSTLKK